MRGRIQLRRSLSWAAIVAFVGMLALVVVIPVRAQGGEPLDDPIPEPIEERAPAITLEPIAQGMTAPNWGTTAPGCASLADSLFVVDQDGVLWKVNLAAGTKSVMLDVSHRLVSLGVGGPGTFDERGFLGVAFDPDFAASGRLYTYTSEPVAGAADFSTMPAGVAPNHQSVVLEWQVADPCNPASVVDPASARELLRIDEPQFNHDAGALAFGPDGALYISLGDGGAADDQGVGHAPAGNGQTPSNILGTIVRIDPDGSNSVNGAYGIPADNPFVGDPGILDEIWAYGFRNPFRFSFDSATGEMYIADVGQHDIEEINRGVAGGNYGWRIKEGTFCFDANGADPGFVYECAAGEVPEDLIDPVAEYDHDEGIAIVGGFVYRGDDVPFLKGRYIFGDYVLPAIGSGRLFALEKNNTIRELPIAGRDTLGLRVLGFGQDRGGEVYVLANETGTPFGGTGVVLRIASAAGESRNFRAHLRGEHEVPSVDTRAQGQTILKVGPPGSGVEYKLIVAQLRDVLAAHIHCAPDGVNGPVGVTLFSDGPVPAVNGILVEGVIAETDAGNACGWQSVADLVAAMQVGEAYVNVHTLAHPSGEIRGQIE